MRERERESERSENSPQERKTTLLRWFGIGRFLHYFNVAYRDVKLIERDSLAKKIVLRLEAGESKSIDLCRASWISAAIGKFAIRLSTLYFTRRGAQSQNINDVGAATRRNPMKSTILHGKYQRKHQRDAIRVSCTELSRDRNRREFALLTFVGECELLFDD